MGDVLYLCYVLSIVGLRLIPNAPLSAKELHMLA